MRYFLRAVKYFVYICLIVTAVMALFVALDLVDKDINTMFREGWTSVYKILAVFALVSLLYPLFGYMKMNAHIHGDWDGFRDGIVSWMNEHGYVLEGEEDHYMAFRRRSAFARAKFMFEDRVTMVWCDLGVKVEGPRREVVSVVNGLEYKFSRKEDLE
ncbi:MAG: hypothetical protein HUJ94_05255 [Bacteroidales bacterium]|nr:hypothetical protein [Bacteroidales bacterium]